ncbi:MAG: hypothetical protein U0264_09240 [Candidatus Kapaibacterium sp.]
MIFRSRFLVGFFLSLIVVCGVYSATAQQVPRSFTVQGVLTDRASKPIADGVYTITVRLYAQAIGGMPIHAEEFLVPLKDGLFHLAIGERVAIPASVKFDRQYFVGISYNGGAEALRLPLTSVPYSLMAETVSDGAITTAKIADGSITSDKLSPALITSLKGGDKTLANAFGAPNFVGGGDVNSASALNVNNYNAILGGKGNVVNALYASIGGGFTNRVLAANGTVAGGNTNTVSATYGFIGSGQLNNVTGAHGSIAGGFTNKVQAGWGAIAGGSTNTVNGGNGFIGGGYSNSISDYYSTIGGGKDNTISGQFGFIGGGSINVVSGNYAVIGGGNSHVVSANYGVIAGGNDNSVIGVYGGILGGNSNSAAGQYGTVLGGWNNSAAGNYSVVLGGSGLTFTADAANSIGYLKYTASRSMSISTPNVAVFGNTDLWLASNDGTTRALKLFSNNLNAAGAYPSTIAKNVALKAPDALVADYTLVLPPSAGASGQVLATNGNGELSWVTPSAGGSAGGDLSGSYPNPSIASAAVTSAKIADANVTMAKLAQAGATSGQVIKWNGSAWAPAADDAGSSLTNFTESVTTTAPNASVPVVQLLATNAEANVDVALTPKGTGALAAQVADNTASGGNKRGENSVDWQMVRSDAAMVASGIKSVVSGGEDNTAAVGYSVVSGGIGNTAGEAGAVVSGGTFNIASQTVSTVSGGTANSAIAEYSAVGGGADNTASGSGATVGGGLQNYASGFASVVSGGNSNQSHGGASVVVGGELNAVGPTASWTTILGGSQLTMTGSSSIGYLAQPQVGGTVRMEVAATNTAVFGNVDLWLASNDNTPRSLRFYEQYQYNSYAPFPNTANYVGFKAPNNIASDVTWTLPNADGSNGQVLFTNGNGVLSWTTPTASGSAGGDLSGSYPNPSIAAGAVTDAKVAIGISGSKISGNITGNAANVTGTVALANGGTGATTQSGARTNLGLGGLAVLSAVGTTEITDGAVTDAKVASGISGSKISGNITGNAANVTGTVALANGGTGATSASGARTNLGLGGLAVLSAVGTTEITDGAVTDAKVASGISGSKISGNITGNAANVTGTVALANGGTGATTQSGARTNLGLGGLAVLSAVGTTEITDGAITDAKVASGISGSKISGNISGNAANVTGTVALANGGTGATTQSGARTNLGLGGLAVLSAVGSAEITDTNVTMAKLAQAGATSGQVIKWNGSAWAPAADNTGGGGLTNFTESVTTDAPNATVPVVQLLATNTEANVDVALTPKGTGALTSQVADNTTVGGNKRGDNSVDWQMVRSDAAMVASGIKSVVGGGEDNTASADYSATLSGYTNTANELGAVVSGGTINTAHGLVSTVGGGTSNSAMAEYSTVSGGMENTASQSSATVSGGQGNTASGSWSVVGGGYGNNTQGGASVIVGGDHNTIEPTASWTTILGGSQLTMTGSSSIGYLAQPQFGGTVRMEVAATNTAVFGNVDLWLASNDNTPRSLRFYEQYQYNSYAPFPNTANYVGFKAPNNIASDVTWTLPNADGSNGQVLFTNGNGVLSWTTPTTSGSAGGDLSGSYPNPSIASGAVKTYQIADSSITFEKIADGSVTLSKLANFPVEARYLLTDSTVDDELLAPTGVTPGTYGSDASALGSVTFPVITVNSTGRITDIHESFGVIYLPPQSVSDEHLSYTGVTENTYGADTATVSFIVSPKGRLEMAAAHPISLTGDVTGGIHSTKVTKLLNRAIDTTAPTTGQVIKWNGSAWAPAADNTGGGGALTYFTESRTVANPNATIPAHVLQATGSEANIKLVLSPKGTGALMATLPDNAVTGGNDRGTNAVDWQMLRTADATRVASGSYSVIAGGSDNVTSGPYATVGGGHNNINTEQWATISGGHSNTINGSAAAYSTIAGGRSNQIIGDHAFIGGGESNSITGTGDWAVVAGGKGNSNDGRFSSILGGGGLTFAAGANSCVGFLGSTSTVATRPMSIATPQTAFFGNVNLWLGSNDGTAHELRFYEAQSSTNITFPPAGTNYTAFKAGTQSADITYTLPSSAPSVTGQVMSAATDGTLTWTTNTLKVSVANNDPAEVAAGAFANIVVAVTGVLTTDAVSMNRAGGFGDLIVGSVFVSAADEITIRVYNPTANPIDLGAADLVFGVVRN